MTSQSPLCTDIRKQPYRHKVSKLCCRWIFGLQTAECARKSIKSSILSFPFLPRPIRANLSNSNKTTGCSMLNAQCSLAWHFKCYNSHHFLFEFPHVDSMLVHRATPSVRSPYTYIVQPNRSISYRFVSDRTERSTHHSGVVYYFYYFFYCVLTFRANTE